MFKRDRWTYAEIIAWHRRQAADSRINPIIRQNHRDSVRWYESHPPESHTYRNDDPLCPVNAIKRPGDTYGS